MIRESFRKETDRQENVLRKLRERHRSIMSALSKCINLEWSQIDYRSQLHMECVQLDERKNDKFLIASNKRAKNDMLI